MNVYESCRTYSLSLSLSLSAPSSSSSCSQSARSLRTPSVLLKFMTTRLCVDTSARPCACTRARTHAHTHTWSHGGERRGPCQFLRASTYALHTYRAHFFASPLLHIIRANNILCIICMPYAAALRAKSRNREPHRRSACPIGPPISLSLFYLLLLSQLDGHVAALSLSIKRGREGIISSPDRSFSLFLQDESRFFRRVDLSSFSRVFIFRGFRTNVRTFIRRSMTSENTFGGNESDSNPSCISGRVR